MIAASMWRTVMKSAVETTFFQRVAKGITTPQDMQVNQTLVPEMVDSFIQSVIDQTPFLKKISVHRLKRLTGNVNVIDISPQGMVRVAEGSLPTEAQRQKAQNIGKQYSCLPMQFFFSLPFSTISDNADNPNFEQEVDGKLAMAVGNDVLDLAWNGTGDDGSAFLKLNKGWLQIAEDAGAGARKPHEVIISAGTTLTVACASVIEALPGKYKETASLVMSRSTREAIVLELGSEIGSALIVNGELKTFLGYPVEVTSFMPDAALAFTPLTNLGWGVNRDIQMYREVSGEKRAVNYTFDMAMDFEIAINDAFAYTLDLRP